MYQILWAVFLSSSPKEMGCNSYFLSTIKKHTLSLRIIKKTEMVSSVSISRSSLCKNSVLNIDETRLLISPYLHIFWLNYACDQYRSTPIR